MLEFTVRIDGAYIADGKNGMEYTIKSDYSQPKGKKCVVTIHQNGVDIMLGSMRFRDLKVAKDFCNKDNDTYNCGIESVDDIETEEDDLEFLDSLCEDGLMP